MIYAVTKPIRNFFFSDSISSAENKVDFSVQRVFIELGLALALNAAVIGYKLMTHHFVILSVSQVAKTVFLVTHPLIPIMTLVLCATLVTLCALRILAGRWMWLKESQQLARFSLINTGLLGFVTPWIHEMGHYLAANALFKNADAVITIFPFKGGETDYAVSYGLTSIGELFGKQNAILAVTAAGALASSLFGMIELTVAWLIKEKFPQLSECLKFHAAAQVLSDFIYAVTAIFASRPNLGHDFIRLWRTGGIHPLIPMAFLAIVPTLSAFI